jgi:hypothetical protein
MNENDDVNLMMEFRQENWELWEEFLNEKGMFDEWNEWYKEQEE